MSGKCPFHFMWKGSSAKPPLGHPGSGGDTARAPPPPAAADHTAAAPAADEPQVATALGPATPAASVASPGDEGQQQCPFLAGVGGVALTSASTTAQAAGAAGSAAAAEAEQAASAPQVQVADSQLQQAQQAGAPAVCPLGFGSGQQPRLGEFHCPLCRSLYCDCVMTACGHRYCSGCIRAARDCPICGADVAPLAPDSETQAKVDRYIEAHAGSHTVWELEEGGSSSGGAGPAQVDGLAGERGRASFLLQLGLRSLAAGNTDAARQRFQLSQAELEQQLAAARAEGGDGQAAVAPLLCRLGAVSGCLGDCCRAEGDAEGTLGHYQRSVELLQGAGEDPEAQQALSVALSKVGELHHLQGDLPAAADLYERALRLRRSLLAATRAHWQAGSTQPRPAGWQPAGSAEEQQQGGEAGGGASAGQQGTQAAAAAAVAAEGTAGEGQEARCSAALDLAASCLKLSGARRGLGPEAEAEALLCEAEGLLDQQAALITRQPPRLQRKHASLAQFATVMRQQAGEAARGGGR